VSEERPARLLLARHGQTEWHHGNRYAGRTDVKLSERGLQEAQALASRAARERPDLIVCSPLIRAVETAQPAAEACGKDLLTDDRLREVDFGEWEGRTLSEIREQDPVSVERFEDDPVEYGFPGGEPLLESAERALEALRELDREHPGKKILVVAHNTLIRVGLCLLLGIPLRDYRRCFPRILNVAISEVRLNERGGGLYTFNDSEHLRGLTAPQPAEERRS
jgi:broad specificity phosphatase PhoE